MSDVHVEGMGVLGCMLARRLEEEAVSFTWNDIDSPYSAWRVSTGLAYPDGDLSNQAGLARWHERLPVTPEAMAVPYVFAHKAPPHKGGYSFTDHGPLREAEPLGVSLNVPEFVENTRISFASRKRASAAADQIVVQAHTTPERSDGFLWGWAARVTFDLPDFLKGSPALYAKAHRFDLSYAYPIPGTGQWWAGSTLRYQKEPRRVDDVKVAGLLDTWRSNAERLLGVSNIEVHEVGQGWRPRALPDDSGWAEENLLGWSLPPMATDGVRRGWLVVDDLIERAGWELI